MLFWLGGWAFGFYSAGSTILSGHGNFFLIFWLGAWTVGGGYAVYTLYRMLGPTAPETLKLGPRNLTYDSGVQPLQLNFGYSRFGYADRSDYWKSYFGKRKVVELDNREIQSLRLRMTSDSNRLTIDAGADRIDIAKSASEVEREWLYRLLANKYALPATTGDAINEA